ncbi:MAG: hypothetical protein U0798_20675 [Gemmataceae bacterium]
MRTTTSTRCDDRSPRSGLPGTVRNGDRPRRRCSARKVAIIDEGRQRRRHAALHVPQVQGRPLVGKRTWGGIWGTSGTPTLMDGGSVTAPSFAIWTPEEGFIIENEGVPPDHDVDIWPKDFNA